MFSTLYADPTHLDFWMGMDPHISRDTLLDKMRRKECYVIADDGVPVGLMRYGLFWDSLPFLNLIYLAEPYRGRGYGREAMLFFEREMAVRGYPAVMTSTQIDEEAQHFYRRLGYRENGCLMLDQPPLEQPMEVLMIKWL